MRPVLLRLALLSLAMGFFAVVAPGAVQAAGGLAVYVGYMDTHTAPSSSKQPNPWPYQDPSRYVGTPCSGFGTSKTCWDASAVRIDNSGSSDVTVHVVVKIGSKSYDLWGDRTVKAGSLLVMTETGGQNSQNFDGSDFPPNDYNGGDTASCKNSGAIPTVSVTVAGATTTYTDSGQVLNGGGVDSGHCVNGAFVSARQDESHPWVQIGSGTLPPPQVTAPSAPLNLAASAGDGSVALSWSPPASDGGAAVSAYQVYRGTASGAEGQTPITTGISGTTFTDRTVQNGTTYYYRVAAVNAVGTSGLSGEASARPLATTTPGPPTPGSPTAVHAPSRPRHLVASGRNHAVRLTWRAPRSNGGAPVLRYRVYRGRASGGERPAPVATTTRLRFTDHSVRNRHRYFYRVTAVNSAGASAPSREASAVPHR